MAVHAAALVAAPTAAPSAASVRARLIQKLNDNHWDVRVSVLCRDDPIIVVVACSAALARMENTRDLSEYAQGAVGNGPKRLSKQAEEHKQSLLEYNMAMARERSKMGP